MTAAAKMTTATAAAISPHGFCGVTTFAGGLVRPLPPCAPPRWPLLTPEPPREAPLFARLFSGLGSLATAAPRCAASRWLVRRRTGPVHLAGGSECRSGTCGALVLDRSFARRARERFPHGAGKARAG